MKKSTLLCSMAALSILVAGCSKEKVGESSIKGKVEGSIVVLTNRTDIVDTKLQEYKEAFEKKYPGTSVEFEAITDYEGTIRTRMGTQEYGDVLCRPNIQSIDFEKYFEPLGALTDFDKVMNFTRTSNAISYKEVVYTYPMVATVSAGIVYNKSVFEKAGVGVPRTTEEFYAAMQAIKDKTDAVPVFMNYPAGWTLNQWEGGLLSASGEPEYKRRIIHEDAPFVPGDGHYELYKMMYEIVKRGLCEKDLLASEWEQSKQDLADGKIGCMVLGSWAIQQVKDLAARPETIGYMPFPFEIKGKKYAEAQLDMPLCINKYSKNKATAYAWIKFISDETDWVQYTESIPVKKGEPYPAVLDSFGEMGVEYIESAPAEPQYEGVYDKIDKESEIGFWSDPEKKRIIDAAMGTTKETFDDIMADWNKRWAKTRAEYVK